MSSSARLLRRLAAAACCAAPSLAAAQAADAGTVSLAVLRFTNGAIGAAHATYEPLVFGIPEVLVSEFALDPRIRLFERARLDDILREHMLAEAQVVDASTAARAGRIIEARHVVFGGFMPARGDSIRIIARLVNVETNAVEAVVTEQDHTDNILPMLAATAAELTRRIGGLVADGRTRAAAVADAPSAPFAAVLAYSRGVAALASGDRPGARAQLLEAIAAAPGWKQAQDALRRVPARLPAGSR